MMRKMILAVCVVACSQARAQQPPPIRQIGKLERVSADSLGLLSARSAIALPSGRVMFDDVRDRRAMLLDSTLTRVKIVADTTSATANAYGMNGATLIRFHGDSVLLIVPQTLSMFVIAPNGSIARTMAIPRPGEANLLYGRWANPGLDAHDRLVYLGVASALPGVMMLNGKVQIYADGKATTMGAGLLAIHYADSSVIVRADLKTRTLDTVAWVRIPKFRRSVATDAQGYATAVETTPDAMPLIDLWTVTRDGTVAIVRGQDFHIDWIDASGKITSSPKFAFEWRKIDDARKTELIDSTVKHWQGTFDEAMAEGRRGGRAANAAVPLVAKRAALSDMPDYAPAFGEHSVDADPDGNVWIRTTQMIDGRPVYYVVSRSGELIDRVQLPAFREVIGFGAGTVYMAVQLPDGKVRLERARVH